MNSPNSITPDQLLAEMRGYVEAVRDVFRGLYGQNPTTIGEPAQVTSLRLDDDFAVSILFLGTAFGEFILSMPRSTAAHLARQAFGEEPVGDEDLRDSFCEALNMVAGSRLKSLGRVYPKLTITAPKTFFGPVRYPSVRALSATLRYGDHRVTACFYLDEMTLDIAESYQESVEMLQNANQELLFANERLKLQQMQLVHSEKMASLGMMAAGVAHEINNPLSFVMSNSEVLGSYLSAFQELFGAFQRLLHSIDERRARDAKLELTRVRSIQEERDIPYILQDTQNLLTETRSGLDRIRAIVNGLKLFSRVDDNGARKVQLNDEIRNTLQLIHNELKYRCKVEFDAGEVPELECDPGELGQVFVNLFVNAAQAMPETGGQLRIQTRARGEALEVVVEDNGCGISPENQARIFDPFFTTKPVGQGTGLGLSISHSIIAKHGGTISVESAVGRGTKFTVSFPVAGMAAGKEAA